MPQIPDLTDPRYRDEVGWFLYHERYDRDKYGGSYDLNGLRIPASYSNRYCALWSAIPNG
jgi:hypothetical protein